MIILVLRNGATFDTISRIGLRAFRIPNESFDFEKNYSDKSNEPGSEEIGQRRLESNKITIRGEWIATDDGGYRDSLNPLVAAFHETAYIRDTETGSQLKVVPESFEINHDNGCFRRSGDFSLSFARISTTWEAIAESVQSFTVPGGSATFDTVDFGDSETRTRIEIIPDANLTSLDVVSLVPGTGDAADRIVGVLSLSNNGSSICDFGRGLVIDNINGKCFTGELSPAVGVDYANGNDGDLDSPTFNSIASYNVNLPFNVQMDSNQFYFNVLIGDYEWRITADTIPGNYVPTYYLTAENNGLGVYGQVILRPPNEWNTFGFNIGNYEPTDPFSPVTLYFPKGSDDNILGGSISFIFDQSAFEFAFNGNTSDIVIATDGSVYKNSISFENLVVDKDGVVGPAGGAAITQPSILPLTQLDIRQYIQPGTSFFRQGVGSNAFSITTNAGTDATAHVKWRERFVT
jgi:hypothetical protein